MDSLDAVLSRLKRKDCQRSTCRLKGPHHHWSDPKTSKYCPGFYGGASSVQSRQARQQLAEEVVHSAEEVASAQESGNLQPPTTGAVSGTVPSAEAPENTPPQHPVNGTVDQGDGGAAPTLPSPSQKGAGGQLSARRDNHGSGSGEDADNQHQGGAASSSSSLSPERYQMIDVSGGQGPVAPSAARQGAAAASEQSDGFSTRRVAGRAAGEAAAAGSGGAPVMTVDMNDPVDPSCPVRMFSPELDNPLLRELLYTNKYISVCQHPTTQPKVGEVAGGRGDAAGASAGGGGGGGPGVDGVAIASNGNGKGKRKRIGGDVGVGQEEESDDDDYSMSGAGGSDRKQGGGSGRPNTGATPVRGVAPGEDFAGASSMANGGGGASSVGLPLPSNGKYNLRRIVGMDDGGHVEDNDTPVGGVGSERGQGGGGGPKTGVNLVRAGGGSGGAGDGGIADKASGCVGASAVQVLRISAKGTVHRRLLRMVTTQALDRLQSLDQFGLFQDPVQNVQGYEEVIKSPMDFTTICRHLQSGRYASIRDVALDVQQICANAMTFNASGDLHHEEAKKLLEGAQQIWPQAHNLLDSLLSIERKAAEHGILGPAASSNACPLDGPFTSFELTPANELAYHMHVAIRREAAAIRAREQMELRVDVGGAEVDAAVRVAELAASSPVMLYTRGEIGDKEKLLLEGLAAHNADEAKKALSRSAGNARRSPIDCTSIHERMQHNRPPPTPVTRRFVSPDGKLLDHDPADQAIPLGPNPGPVEEVEVTGVRPAEVVPEWKVHRSAVLSRSGASAKRQLKEFEGLLAKVASVSETRLRVDTSTVQGRGVFANQGIRAHEMVLECVGEVLGDAEATARFAGYSQTRQPHCIVRLGDNPPTYIDATSKSNFATLLNHSCSPNLYKHTVVAGKGQTQVRRVCFFSLRNIREGEELFYSYPAPHTVGLGEIMAPACACRAAGCRGRMSRRENPLNLNFPFPEQGHT